jgi:uncharacterized protein YcfJ
MKKTLLVGCILFSSLAIAQSTGIGQVISVTPVTEQIATTRQQCVIETVRSTEQGVAGPILGAIVGGVIGNQIGGGSGKDIATGVGIIAGTMAGNEIQNAPKTQQRCTPMVEYQTVTKGFNVSYVFNNVTYTQFMNRHPGSQVTVTVTAQ